MRTTATRRNRKFDALTPPLSAVQAELRAQSATPLDLHINDVHPSRDASHVARYAFDAASGCGWEEA